MEQWLDKAMQGVDPDSPDAALQVFMNLMGMLPWTALIVWSVVFVVVGAVLGWWRGRTVEGIVWAAALGPFGWIVVLLRPRPRPKAMPPPLPRL
ncbi:hypothetical protein DVT68_14075 [Dyella solisilvae]|uniref:Uncharacterized protein n=1 Tax=Dyella solisilvae TaxID=1920168 RepID=A0A370K846_9GAMM|nr:hypothetical protein [Dyella solisilvae]RDI98200.1 hypothetical protein DVT68_14075 [Dyella solisilvae]